MKNTAKMKNGAAALSIDIIEGDLQDIAEASHTALERIRAVRTVLQSHFENLNKDRYDELVSAAVLASDTLLGVIKLDFPTINNHIVNANANLNSLPRLIEPENESLNNLLKFVEPENEGEVKNDDNE
jgi:hypothetical protein